MHATGADASYTVGLTPSQLAAPSSSDGTATVWVFVSVMLLIIAVFLALFVIQVRRFRRGRYARHHEDVLSTGGLNEDGLNEGGLNEDVDRASDLQATRGRGGHGTLFGVGHCLANLSLHDPFMRSAMMRPAPVVFEPDKTARSVWLKVVPGTNDNARMRSIVESVTCTRRCSWVGDP